VTFSAFFRAPLYSEFVHINKYSKSHKNHKNHGNRRKQRPQQSQPQRQDEFRKTHSGPDPSLKHKDWIAKTRPAYFDEARDRRDVQSYYSRINENASPEDLYRQLSNLVEDTHKNRRAYDPDDLVYPWVDLRPSMRLQSVYSPTEVTSGAPLHLKEIDGNNPALLPVSPSLQRQAEQWVRALSQGPTDAVNIAMRIAEVETMHYYNCEHVVPRIWFNNDRVAEGDLHHLFACETEINHERSSLRLKEVEDPLETFAEGVKKVGEFEPSAGKGEVARATLYFLLRYPGQVGNHPYEYTKEDIQNLVRWSNENPVTLHEHHRNQAIADIQGNRNPFIDHPDWVNKVDFSRGMGHVPPDFKPKAPGTGYVPPGKRR